jgi:hypothetical protein
MESFISGLDVFGKENRSVAHRGFPKGGEMHFMSRVLASFGFSHGPCTLHLGHHSLLNLIHLSNHYVIPAHLDPRLSTLFRFPFESLSTPTPTPTLQLNPEPHLSILNRFLFPAPPPSYGWDSFPGELICIASRDGVIVPCTVRVLPAPPHSEPWCHSRHHR